jgi:hypothetical protein
VLKLLAIVASMGATASKDKRRKQHPQHHQQQQQERKPKPEAEAKNNKVIKLGNDSSKPNSDNESHKQHPSNHSSPGNSAGIPIRGMKGSPKNASGLHQNGGSRGSSLITDDEVKVNLAMADLMAFLLVVANNSNNLPLTRRDDPEAAKTVSTLTSDEYARKSAAFVPADVRVIGGSFLKYGRVWDLPTSREYSANDGVQEPGMFWERCRFFWVFFAFLQLYDDSNFNLALYDLHRYRPVLWRSMLQCNVEGFV